MMRILFAVLCLGLVSCDESKAPNYGIPTSEEDIINAQRNALNKIDPTNIKQGEFVYFIKTQELYSSQEPTENLMEEEGLTVTEKTEFFGFSEITVVSEIIDHMTDGSPHYKFKDVFEVGTSIVDEPTSEPQEKLMKQLDAKTVAALDESVDIKFYNLRVREEKISQPKKVLEHTPCPADTDCRINATIITYDLVVFEAGQPPQKNQFEVWISSEVPYFASILKSCVSAIVTIETVRPLVRQCKSVFDYKYN